MPYVCAGNLGKHYEYGQVIPDFNEWPPHAQSLHMRNGNVKHVTDAEADVLQKQLQHRQRAAAAKQLDRDLIKANGAVSAAKSAVKRLSEELRVAQLHLELCEKSAAEISAVLVDVKAGLPPEVQVKAAPTRPAAVAEKPEPPVKSDVDVRKALLSEVAAFGRRRIIEYAGATEKKWGDHGELIGSGYGIDLSHLATKPKDMILQAFIEARLAQLKAESKPAAEEPEILE